MLFTSRSFLIVLEKNSSLDFVFRYLLIVGIVGSWCLRGEIFHCWLLMNNGDVVEFFLL